MYPKLFGVEWLNMWGLMLGLGVIAALVLFWFLCKRFKLSDESYNFYSWVAMAAIAIGLFGAWVFQQLYGAIDAAAKGEKYIVGAGFTFLGGLVFGVIAFVAGTAIFAKPAAKKDFYTVVNFAAPCIVIAHALGRIGCFCAGCCYGVHSDHGLTFPYGASRGKVVPTQLYEALFLLALFGVMMLLILKYKKTNFMIILYGAAYAVFRFIIEYWRDDYRGANTLGMSPSQWQSLGLALAAGVLALFVFYFKRIPFAGSRAETAAAETSAAAASEFYKTAKTDESKKEAPANEPEKQKPETTETDAKD